MRLLHSTIQVINHHGVLLDGTTLGLLHILFQIPTGLVHLEITRGLIKTTVYRLIELLLLHLHHLLHIGKLEQQKTYEGEAHDCRYNPNRTFLHCRFV